MDYTLYWSQSYRICWLKNVENFNQIICGTYMQYLNFLNIHMIWDSGRFNHLASDAHFRLG